MRKSYLIIFLLCFLQNSYAQTLFNQTSGAYGAFNEAKSLQISPDSGFSILGSTGGLLTPWIVKEQMERPVHKVQLV
jgi:hypothetical protein